jgi:hypothetical protein
MAERREDVDEKREGEARGGRVKRAAVLIHFLEKGKSLGHAKKRMCQLFLLVALTFSLGEERGGGGKTGTRVKSINNRHPPLPRPEDPTRELR